MRYTVTVFLLMSWTTRAQQSARFEWPHDPLGIASANRTEVPVVEAVVNQALAPETVTAHVRAFRFVPLETIDRIDLVASIDTSGRGMFNTFIAVWPNSSGYGHAMLPSDAQTVLARDVIDLDGTGLYKVVAGIFPGGYQGKDTIPLPWYTVQALKGGKWIDISDQYPELYQADLIPRSSLLLQVVDAASSGDKVLVQSYRGYSLFIRFKYERAVLHNPRAGLESALAWAESPDSSVRVLAAKTLGEIADPRSISVLRVLAGSEDIRVHIAAQDALMHTGAVPDRRQK